MTITSRSVINHSGMRLAGSVIACASTTRVVCAGRGQVSMNQITISIYLMAMARLDAEDAGGISMFDQVVRLKSVVPGSVMDLVRQLRMV
jgi:hypothetical protein